MTDHEILDWLRDNAVLISREGGEFVIVYGEWGTQTARASSIKEAVRIAAGAKYATDTYSSQLRDTTGWRKNTPS